MTEEHATVVDPHATIEKILDQRRPSEGDPHRCEADPCYDPLCPVHAEQERSQLRKARWAPPPEAEPWRSLRAGTLSIASVLDHTILRPEATAQEITAGCTEAIHLGCAAFCANLIHMPLVSRLLQGSSVTPCTVVGFPLGATPTAIKQEETRWALAQGAREIDMVIPIGSAKARQHQLVFEDIQAVTRIAHQGRAICKVILETALLSDEEKIIVAMLAMRAGADFVKTSTGYSKSGATPEDVALLRLVVGGRLGVKAAGGIRTREQAVALITSGANRIGTSSSLSITGDKGQQEGQ